MLLHVVNNCVDYFSNRVKSKGKRALIICIGLLSVKCICLLVAKLFYAKFKSNHCWSAVSRKCGGSQGHSMDLLSALLFFTLARTLLSLFQTGRI